MISHRKPKSDDHIEVGDIVMCVTDEYTSVRYGDVRPVLGINEYGNLKLPNKRSPYDTSDYNRANFRLKHKKIHQPQETKMAGVMFIAIRIHFGDSEFRYGDSIEMLVNTVNSTSTGIDNDDMLASKSYEEVKRYVERRIKTNPTEKWLLFSGTTLAETPTPPITFRSA